jgi:adenine deaminase
MGPTYIVKNRITLSSVISIAIVAIFLMYISPKISSALGIQNDVGTIEPGKQADIMVLSDNPMEDISNNKKIEAVINNGQFVNGYNCINK